MTGGTVRRLAAAAALLWGLALAAASALAIPDALAAHHLVDGARPLVQPAYLARQQALIAEGRAALEELNGAALPALATRLGETADRLHADLAARNPGVAAGLAQMPAILTTTSTALGNLQRHHADFVAADGFPANGLSPPLTAVLGIVLGVALLVLGVLGLRSSARWPLAGVLLLSAAAAILPPASSAPARAQGVAAMVGSLNLSQPVAAQTRQRFDTVVRIHDGLEGQVLPAAAARLGISTEALRNDIEAGQANLQAFEADYPTILALFRPDVELRAVAVSDFSRIRDVPVVALTWTFVAVNGAVALLAAAGLLGLPRRRLPRTA